MIEPRIPVFQPYLGPEVRDAITRALDSGSISIGSLMERTRDVKLRLLESHGDRWQDRRHLRARADWALRREIVGSIRTATLPERRVIPTLQLFGASVRRHPRLALQPDAWRLVIASLLGPRALERLRGRS